MALHADRWCRFLADGRSRAVDVVDMIALTKGEREALRALAEEAREMDWMRRGSSAQRYELHRRHEKLARAVEPLLDMLDMLDATQEEP